MSKRKPLDPALYELVVAEAKDRFAVWPSAYASGWVVQEYQRRGGEYSDAKPSGGGLVKWFGEEWVDLSRPIRDEDGNLVGYEPCGRAQSSQRAYPKCRPLDEAMKMTPKEVASAIRRKRAVEAHVTPSQGRKPVNVPTYRSNPTGYTVRCDCGWAWEIEEDDPEPLRCHKCWHDGWVQVSR